MSLSWKNQQCGPAYEARQVGLSDIEILQLMTTSGDVGFWRTELGTSRTYCTTSIARIFGVAHVDGPIDVVEYTSKVHPEDLAEFMAVLEQACQDHKPFNRIYRVRMPNGRYKQVRTIGFHRQGDSDQGELVGMTHDLLPSHGTDWTISSPNDVTPSS